MRDLYFEFYFTDRRTSRFRTASTTGARRASLRTAASATSCVARRRRRPPTCRRSRRGAGSATAAAVAAVPPPRPRQRSAAATAPTIRSSTDIGRRMSPDRGVSTPPRCPGADIHLTADRTEEGNNFLQSSFY